MSYLILKEIILQNFMSYEYARIPFKPGLNLICGPNGAGKSSILLGISVALGQSYTERSRRLLDLIRWNKDQARVTLIFEDEAKSDTGPRKDKSNRIILSRVLRKDGEYWFELNDEAVAKSDVTGLLSRLGIDPENMLIIMHQNMVETFTILSPQEKLRMLESAVGFEAYRKRVLRAQEKLSKALGQEEAVGKLLKSAEQTLNYWREQYNRLQEKRQLDTKKKFLEREFAWAHVIKVENIASEFRRKISRGEAEVSSINNEITKISNEISDLQRELKSKRSDLDSLLSERLSLEKEISKHETISSLSTEHLQDIDVWRSLLSKGQGIDGWFKELVSRETALRNKIEESAKQLKELNVKSSNVQEEMSMTLQEINKLIDTITDKMVKSAILSYRKDILIKDLENMNNELNLLVKRIDESIKRAEEKGPRFMTLRNPDDILEDLRVTDGHLAALSDVSDKIESMYESYSKLYSDLKEKAIQVAENREKALVEVGERMEAWKEVIKKLIDQINPKYQAILSMVNASGDIRVTTVEDIDEAGLEILVGFKGASPITLNAYTQSGGERSLATMAFLLALQQNIRSQIRAVDEFDIHMDPQSRELIASALISSIKGTNAQYIVITPSQITFAEEDTHVIVVQNIEGKSRVKEVEQVVQ